LIRFLFYCCGVGVGSTGGTVASGKTGGRASGEGPADGNSVGLGGTAGGTSVGLGGTAGV